jgi:REP element-mobilizing transposase RayT
MPRSARLDAPGVLHHVMIRGIERRNIFRNNRDRNDLIARLNILLPETQTQCYAWAFMHNHAHFLFRSGSDGLSTLMRRLLTGYAVAFNKRHKRHGHLFQNRYKSIICQENLYLKELVRYIHLNPVRGKRVAGFNELGNYPYSGHSALLENQNRNWQDTEYVLKLFGRNVNEARKNYLRYVEAGISRGHRDDLVGGGLIRSIGGWKKFTKSRLNGKDSLKGDERILGDSGFVESILAEANQKYDRQHQLQSLGYDLNKIAEKVGKLYKLDPGYIFSKGRQKQRVEPRNLLCFWAARELGMPITELARLFEISPSAISYAVAKGEAIAKRNKYQLLD